MYPFVLGEVRSNQCLPPTSRAKDLSWHLPTAERAKVPFALQTLRLRFSQLRPWGESTSPQTHAGSSALIFIYLTTSPVSARAEPDKDFSQSSRYFSSLLGSIKLKSCFASSVCSLNLETPPALCKPNWIYTFLIHLHLCPENMP